ncbi:MAG TPA: molybdopterin-dependent oxidoreductase, partial [Terriglobales bacterium]|nr:molybdopterin-dependent oxidoreductase [Terriglobales bacterium]
PLDCPICDKAGECLLQDYSYNYSSNKSQTEEPRRKLEKRKDIGPRMLLDQERCILCRRCVRFTREISKTNELGVFNMGDRSVLDILSGDKPLANDYSICTADICPVGALVPKDFHHKVRVWFLKKTTSVCPSCANGCNITVNHYRERIWRMMPRRNDEVNESWMCDHGRLNYDYVNHERRLRTPLMRRHQQLEACDWDEAITAAASALRHESVDSGGGGVGALASPHLTNEESFRFAQLLQALGADCVDVPVRLGPADDFLIKPEKAANATGARRMGLGAKTGAGWQQILERVAAGDIRLLYICGSDILDLAEPQLLQRALDKVSFLIVQDVLPSALTERADVVLPSTTFAEKNGTFTNFQGRVQRIHRAIQVVEQPCDGTIFTRLLSQITEFPPVFEPVQVFAEEIAASVDGFQGMTYEGLGNLGRQLAEPGARTEGAAI